MPEPPDLETLSRRFLDLWQDQMTALAADPEAAEIMTRLMGMMAAPGMAALVPLAFRGAPGGGATGEGSAGEAQGDPETGTKGKLRASSRTAAPAAPSRDGDLDLDELARRLADVERRLSRLEARAGAGRGKAKGKPRRGQSRGA